MVNAKADGSTWKAIQVHLKQVIHSIETFQVRYIQSENELNMYQRIFQNGNLRLRNLIRINIVCERTFHLC